MLLREKFVTGLGHVSDQFMTGLEHVHETFVKGLGPVGDKLAICL